MGYSKRYSSKKKIGFLIMVILTASVYIMLGQDVKLDVGKDKSTFYVWENEKFVISGIESNKIYNETKLLVATNRTVINLINDNLVNLMRIVLFEKVSMVDNYQFNGDLNDKELFPVSETHKIINAKGLIYQYQVTKLIWSGGNKDLTGQNEASFGRKMKISWVETPYFAKITQQKGGFGTLTLKYRIVSDNEIYSIRLFDPESRYWVGGTGSWSQTTHWSNISGGSTGFSVPNSSTNVYVDNNSAITGYSISLDSSPTTLFLNVSGIDSSTKRVFIKSSTLGTRRTISASNVVVSNTDFQDVAFNQTTDLSSGSPIGDCGGNSNITFTTAANLYWANNTGSWSDSTKWYLGTNGTGGAGRVPLCQDTALFDNASFTGASKTVTQNMPRIGSVNWTGVTNNPTFTTSTAASVFGSLILSPNMTLTTSTQTYTFEGRGNYYYDTKNLTFFKSLNINNPTGYLNIINMILNKEYSVDFQQGGINVTDGGNVTLGQFYFNNAGVKNLYLGINSLWTLNSQYGSQWVGSAPVASNLIFNAGTSTIKIIPSAGTTIDFNGANLNYSTFWIAPNIKSISTISDSNSFNNFIVNNNQTVKFTAGTTQKIASWNASGNASSYVTIASTSGTNAILNYTGVGTVSSDYLNISDMTVNPALTWYAGSHSINSSDTNWIMTDVPSNTTPPTYSLNSTNSTIAGTDIKHSLYWQDNTALSGYIFSFDNSTGTFVNDSFVSFSGTGNWSNITKSVNSTVGSTIRWIQYANDTSNNWNTSLTYSYLTTSSSSCVCPSINTNWEIDLTENCILYSNCDLGLGNLTWINTGTFTINATLNIKNISTLSNGQIIYIKQFGILNGTFR